MAVDKKTNKIFSKSILTSRMLVSIGFFVVLFLAVYNLKPALAVDGLMNGHTITQETDNFLLWLQTYDAATPPFYTDRLFMDKTGNMGIGITNPGTKLDISGSFRNSLATTHSLLGGAGNTVVMADNTGTLYSTSTASFISSNFYSSTIVVNPTSGPGWYRIASSAQGGGTVYINAGMDNRNQRLEFNYTLRSYVGDNNSVGTINVLRSMNYNTGPITQIRIAANSTTGDYNAYLDIYVNSATVPAAFTVYGTNGASFLATPQFNPPANTYNQVIDLNEISLRGLATSQNLKVGGNALITGNVGIGTTNPTANLTLKTNVVGANLTMADNSGVTTAIEAWGGYANFGSYSNSPVGLMVADDTKLLIDVNGNVGINTFSPGTKLDLAGTFRNSLATTHSLLGGSGNVVVMADNTGTLYTSTAASSLLWSGTTGGHIWNANSGNVGIGTTNPNFAKLSVIGNMYVGGAGDGLILSADGSTSYIDTATNGLMLRTTRSSDEIQFQTNSLTRMFINGSDGSVGIGTTNPGIGNELQAKLEVTPFTGSATAFIRNVTNLNYTSTRQGLIVGEGLNTGDMNMALWTDGTNNIGYLQGITYGAGYNPIVFNPNGGNVGIGLTGPNTKLDISGTFRNSLATTHTLLGGAGNAFVMTDNTGSLYSSNDFSSTGLSLSGVNLIRNADLAFSDNFWAAIGGSATTYSRVRSDDPTAPVRSHKKVTAAITATGAGDVWAVGFNVENLKLNTDYNASCYFKTSGTVDGYFHMERFYADWTGRSDVNSANLAYANDGAWHRQSFVFNTGAYPNVDFRVRGFDIIGSWDITGCQLTEGKQLNSFSLNPLDAIHEGSGRYVTGTSSFGSVSKIISNNYSSTNAFTNYIAAPEGTFTNKYALVTESGSGNVGIGLTNPGTLLDVAGTFRNSLATTHSLLGAAGNVVVMSDNTGTLYGTPLATFTSSNNFWGGTKNGNIWNGDAGLGKVGIGTTAPASELQISYSNPSTAAIPNGITILNSASVPGLFAGIRFSTYGDPSGGAYPKQFIGTVRTAAGSGVGDIIFLNRNAADTSVVAPTDERMRITAAGDVAIGTTTPTAKLSVNGTIDFDSRGMKSLGQANAGTARWAKFATLTIDNPWERNSLEYYVRGRNITGILRMNITSGSTADSNSVNLFRFDLDYTTDESPIFAYYKSSSTTYDIYAYITGWNGYYYNNLYKDRDGQGWNIGTVNEYSDTYLDPPAGYTVNATNMAAGLPSGIYGQTIRHNGNDWVADSGLYNNGINVGIGGYDSGQTAKFAVNGTVGIGHDSATSMLDILSTYGAQGFKLAADRDDANGILFQVYDRDTPNEGLVFTDYNRLGIGTTTPSAQLTVNSYAGDGTMMFDLHDAGDNVSALRVEQPDGGDQGVIIKQTGNVGIGTSTPAAKLSVYSNASDGLPMFDVYDQNDHVSAFKIENFNGTSAGVIIKQTGNVGINVTNPTTRLDLSGTFRNSLATTHSLLGGAGNAIVMTDNTGALYTTSTASFAGASSLWGGTKNGTIWNGDAGVGNIGIGTTSPKGKLEVASAANWLYITDTTAAATGVGGRLRFTGLQSSGGSPANFGEIRGIKENSNDTNAEGSLIFMTNNDAAGESWEPAERMRINSDGNVGIGTAAPRSSLSISGANTILSIRNTNDGNVGQFFGESYSAGQLGLYNDGASAWGVVPATTNKPFFGFDNTGRVGTLSSAFNMPLVYRNIIDDGSGNASFSGNVGIGTTNPYTDLQIAGPDAPAYDTARGILAVGTGNGSNAPHMMFGFDTAPAVAYGWINATKNASTWANIVLVPNSGGALGNVGIGNISPATKLDVSGTLRNTLATTHSLLGGAGNVVVMSDNTGTLYSTSTASFISGNSLDLWKGTKNGNIWNGDAGVGNVGIGTTNPTTKLDVAGNALFGGTVARVSIGNQAADGDVHFGASGMGAPPTGNQDYGFYAAYNAYRSSDGNWYHSRPAGGSLQGAVRFTGSNTTASGINGFRWDTSANVGTSSIAWTNLMTLTNAGNVGIGLTNPGAKLDVLDTMTLSSSDATNGSRRFKFGDLSGQNQAFLMQNNSATWYSGLTLNHYYTGANVYTFSDTSAAWKGAASILFKHDASILFKTIADGSVTEPPTRMTIDNTGNVGIGVTNPAHPLEVQTTVSGAYTPLVGFFAPNNTSAGNASQIRFGVSNNTGNSGEWRYVHQGSNNANNRIDFGFNGVAAPMISYLNGGNVGINITNPGTKLDVAGTFRNSLATTHSLLGGSGNVVVMVDNTGALYTTTTASLLSGGANFWGGAKNGNIWNGDAGAGNVGIGTTVPGGKLHVSDGVAVSSTLTSAFSSKDIIHSINNSTGGIRLVGASDTPTNRLSQTFIKSRGSLTAPTAVVSGDTIGDLLFGGYDGSGVNFGAGLFAYVDGTPSAGNTPLRLSFVTGGNSGNRAERLTIKNDGNVGIGLTNPGTKLDVSGTARNSLATTHSLLGGAGNVVVMADNTGALYATSSVAITGGYLPLTGGALSGNLNMGGKDILNINKLSVSTIDPLYNIKGINYSTFAASIAGGVKEEYIGRADIKAKSSVAGEREYVIDFDNLEHGSDLWVWRQTVDFSENNVEILITPYGGFAQVYSSIKDNKIIFTADKPVSVHYRLSGRRVDWQKWPTKAKDQTEKAGFVIE